MQGFTQISVGILYKFNKNKYFHENQRLRKKFTEDLFFSRCRLFPQSILRAKTKILSSEYYKWFAKENHHWMQRNLHSYYNFYDCVVIKLYGIYMIGCFLYDR